MPNGDLMKDIAIIELFGQGTYLLYNYCQRAGELVAEKGYNIIHCDDLSRLAHVAEEVKADFILINSDDKDPVDYYNFLSSLNAPTIKNVFIDCVIRKDSCESFLNHINTSQEHSYYLDINFPLQCFGHTEEPDIFCSLKVVLSQGNGDADRKIAITESIRENVFAVLPYIRPGDNVLIISNEYECIKHILSAQTKSSYIDVCLFDDLSNISLKDKGYHFIFIESNEINNEGELSALIQSVLLPAGRCVISCFNKNIAFLLHKLEIEPEVYFDRLTGSLNMHIHQGEEIDNTCVMCMFMKNPISNTPFAYEETIYGYSSPPENLLAFARDYTNPWLLRGIVEFPFRNRSEYHLERVSKQVLSIYDKLSPDYAAALAVLGYQALQRSNKTEDIISEISSYCSALEKINKPSPHQIRWYISLSTLAGLFFNKKNKKILSLKHFSNAANINTDRFSPSIGTKTLQSLYYQTIILLSLGRTSCANITVERGLRRGIRLLYQRPEELIGKISHPFNFVMFIYHDIIDWLIKLINVKNAIYIKKYNLINKDNANAWSTLLHDRMNGINGLSQMVAERDKAIYSQKSLIDERDKTINSQNSLIDERDEIINSQKILIDERDETIASQKIMIDERDNTIFSQKAMIDERDDTISSQKRIIDEQNEVISSQKFIIERRDDAMLSQKAMIDERDNTILSQKAMIDERDNTISFQGKLIDERDGTILSQKALIDGRDDAILSQKVLIDERDDTISFQGKLINERDDTIFSQKALIDGRDDAISSQKIMIDERDSTITQQITLINQMDVELSQIKSEFDQHKIKLRRINKIPLIGLLFRFLNK